MFDDQTQVAWQAMPNRAPVVAADGSEIGTAESTLGDQSEDIFHGIVVTQPGSGRHLEMPAAATGTSRFLRRESRRSPKSTWSRTWLKTTSRPCSQNLDKCTLAGRVVV